MRLRVIEKRIFQISIIVFAISVLLLTGVLIAEKTDIVGKNKQTKLKEADEKVLPGSFWDEEEFRLM